MKIRRHKPPFFRPPKGETFCTACGQVKADEHFDRRSAGSERRRSTCKACRTLLRHQKQALERDKWINANMVNAINSAQRRGRLTLAATDKIFAQANEHFGGLDKMAERFIEHLTRAEQRDPGSRRVLVAWECVQHMLVAANAARQSEAEEIRAMDTSDVQAVILQAALDRPDVVFDLARELGAKVVEPVQNAATA